MTFGQTMGGRVTYALGYTGLGVGASRWAGGVVRDFILRPDEDRLRLRIVDQPADPLPAGAASGRLAVNDRSATSSTGPTATRAAAVVLLRTLDALGIGFDS